MLTGLSLIHSPSKKLKFKWLLSRFQNNEKENFDITGAYLFGDRDFDNTSTTFGEIVNPLGAGLYQNYARNELKIRVLHAAHKGSVEKGKHFIQWGAGVEQTNISDKLQQFEYRDSAGYSLPYVPDSLPLFYAQNNSISLDIVKLSGYVQDNLHFSQNNSDVGR